MDVPNITPTPQLPETRPSPCKTRMINILGGPACEKSLFCAAIMLHLHLRRKTVEQVPDFAKLLVWQRDHDALKNQHHIAQRQFRMLESRSQPRRSGETRAGSTRWRASVSGSGDSSTSEAASSDAPGAL